MIAPMRRSQLIGRQFLARNVQAAMMGRARVLMPWDLCNQRQVLDTSDDPESFAAIGTVLDIDALNEYKALH
jgi:hypothetical protein